MVHHPYGTTHPFAMYRQQAGANQQSLSQQSMQQHAANTAQGQQHAASLVGPESGQQYWHGYGHPYASHHNQGSGAQQFLDPSEMITPWAHGHAHHYSHHFSYSHQAYQQHHQQQQQMAAGSDWSGDEGNNAPVDAGEPSPPITVSGSEISSPGTPATPPANNNNIITTNQNAATPTRSGQARSPFEWMKKQTYQNQPNPGKTRTKDKYRVVYSDHQRLELEKEFHTQRYITIRRKTELAANLALSERQVKIWFQNRRAKERKQMKKREELEQKDIKPDINGLPPAGGMGSLAPSSLGAFAGMSSMLNSLMHSGPSPPLGLGHPGHLSIGHAHAHHQHSSLSL